MGLFDDLFHQNKQERNRQGREQNAELNRGAPDPYGSTGGQQNQVTFDETGRPILNGRPINRPGADYALDYQYLVEQEAERRRNSLWQDAQNTMRQGLDLFQSYRPGGSAALASGMFNQSASMYGTQAMNTAAPDMMSEYRHSELQQEKRERERARQFSERLALTQVAMNPLGVLSSGPTPQNTSAPVGTTPPPAAAAPPAGQPAPGGAVAPGAPASALGGTGAGGLGGMSGPSGMIPPMDGGGYAAQGDDGQGGVSRVGRTGGGGGTTADGGYGAGGSAGGPVGAGGSRRMGGGHGSGMGGAGGGGPPISTYTGPEVATRAQAMAPGASDALTSSWTGSAVRTESVRLRVAAARSELIDAMGSSGSLFGGAATQAALPSVGVPVLGGAATGAATGAAANPATSLLLPLL